MRTVLLMGDEAVALAAVEAGIAGAFSYPGTPATEIFEALMAMAERGEPIWARWSTNEKVAYEEALGMSYAGQRALVSMKHVGLNVAADPFVNSGLTGVNGGLVCVVADDPGMHSSQNEQDSRYYAELAKLPMFEPSNQQEAYDMTRDAFELSEKIGLPVMLRLVTRLAHSRANVTTREDNKARRDNPLPTPNPDDWTLVPANSRRRFRRLIELQPKLQDVAQSSPYNSLTLAGPRGIIASGIAYSYVREALGTSEEDSLLKVGTYPLPLGLLRDLVRHCDEILVIEEGYPFIEGRLNGLLGLPAKVVKGKLRGPLPEDGELTPETVSAALGNPLKATNAPETGLVGRPPQLCKGCPHSDSFMMIIDAVSSSPHPALFSDIGCYTLGAMPPYRAVHSCVDMGASISMAFGASQAGLHPVICTIGDSTFTHSGITPLLDAVRADANMTVMILDNATVAMTGAQESMASGQQLVDLLVGLGVKDIQVIEPARKNHQDNVAALHRAFEHRGLSVIISKRACIRLDSDHQRAANAELCVISGLARPSGS